MSDTPRVSEAHRSDFATAPSDLRVGIVGPGRLGLSLALALLRAGVSVVGHVSRSESSAARAERLLRVSRAADVSELIARRPSLVVLTVPDDVVARLAVEVRSALDDAEDLRLSEGIGSTASPAVAHTSGVTPVAALDPVADRGAVTFAFHPLQTFSDPESGSGHLAGCYIAVTPGDRGGWDEGATLATLLGANPFLLHDQQRVLYHAAACIASNYLVALEWTAERLFVQAGLPERDALQAFLPLVLASVDNIASQGPVQALTGPLSRGDRSTVLAHLRELQRKAPWAVELYRALGSTALHLVRTRAELRAPEIDDLEDALLSPNTQPTFEGGRP